MQGGIIATSFAAKPAQLALDIRPDEVIQQALGLPGADIATNPGSVCWLVDRAGRAGTSGKT
jgi:hypothetical protein